MAGLIYAAMKVVLRPRNKVVLLSRQSNLPSRDFALLAAKIREMDPSVEVVIRCRFIGSRLLERVAYLGEVLAQMYHLATSRACVVDGYVVPVSVLTHRDGLFIVQLWHALGAVKRFGYQALDAPGGRSSQVAQAMKMHRNYDLVVCGGPATVPIFAQAFGVSPHVVEALGLPRVDHLIAHALDASIEPAPPAIAAIAARFPLLAEKNRTVVLYAPTFRKDRPHHYKEVCEAFSAERYVVVVKPHPLVSAEVSGHNVVNAGDVDILDLLPLAHVVITDYSAVAFEAAALDVALYFYVYDLDEYRRAHGLNIDPTEQFGQVTFARIDAIRESIESGAYDSAAIEHLRSRYLTATDGRCTERIAERILQRVGAGARP